MKPDGGPAFPKPAGWNGLKGLDEHRGNEEQDGMSMRDYFAAACMQGMCSTPQWPGKGDYEEIARRSYEMADAMLAAREPERAKP